VFYLGDRVAVHVGWYLEGRILQVTDCVTEEEWWERDRLLLQYLDEGGKPPCVHLLLDYRALDDAERAVCVRSFRSYSEAVFARRYPDRRRVSQHYLLGWLLTIDAPGGHHLAQTVAQVGNIRYRAFDTLEEGVAFLKSVDETLPRDLR
jgi:hypothetical protein